MRKEEINSLNAFEMWVWRRIGKVSWMDKRTNEQVLSSMNKTGRLKTERVGEFGGQGPALGQRTSDDDDKTHMAILDICDKISRAIDNNAYAIGVFIDLSQAFDTINYDISIQKFYHYGVGGIILN